jgi:1-acyl-sn-glycerol-3-phosphate acyltransferase
MMTRVRDQLAELRDAPAPATFFPRPVRELPGDVSGTAA